MRYGSVCSGIEAATVAWQPLGWHAAFYSEIDPFPSAVLAHHYPDVPNLGDFTGIRNRWLGRIGIDSTTIDVLVGGTPCQSFSVAGLRGGLADSRGNLTLEFLRLARRLRPEWLVWENVPGVLSSNDGRDFGAFLGGLVELGYGWAYRVLDAQHLGVPQRRRRVFVVGCLGDWRRAVAVLFERHSLSGNPPPGRAAESGVAPSVTPGARRASGQRSGEQLTVAGCLENAAGSRGFRTEPGEHVIPAAIPVLTTRSYADRDCQHEKLVAFTGKDHGQDMGEDVAPTLRSMTGLHANAGSQLAVAFGWNKSSSQTLRVCETTDALQASPTSNPAVFQCQGNNVGPMGTLRKGDGGLTSGVPFVVNAAESRAKASHARESEIARRLDAAGSFASAQGGTVVAQPIVFQERGRDGGRNIEWQEDQSYSLRAIDGGGCGDWFRLAHQSDVRRLTPRECERLMGFPDDWTLVPYRGKPAADGPRYKAIGNSIAIPPLRWIGRRIQLVHDLIRSMTG